MHAYVVQLTDRISEGRGMTESNPAGGTRATPLNRLLAALPPEEWEILRPDLEDVSLTFKQGLYEPEVPAEYIYFPYSGVVSLLTEFENGSAVEVGTVGPEGIVGLPIFLEDEAMASRAFVQVPGKAARIGIQAYRRAIDRCPRLHRMLSRYTLALLNMLAQNSACNRTHTVEERLARWLLMTQDRVHEPTFPMTQEFIAHMLGVSRPTVSMTASILQKAGFMTYIRGTITVTDRPGLEAACCECYRVIRRQFDRLVGSDG
jgi:CRP-like cAMP-binding protein